MKQTTLSLFLIFILALPVFSQENNIYSIGLNAISIMQLPRIANQDPLKYLTTNFNGGMFKVNDRQISYRVSGSFINNKSVQFQSDCTNCELDNGQVTDYRVKLGFEKSLNYSHIQPYLAFDLGYRYNRFNGIQNYISLQRTISDISQLETVKNGVTLAPSLGIRITPVELISVFAEGSLEFYYSNLHSRIIKQDPSFLVTETSEHKKEFLFTPITIGIQIHLGNKY
ncbi:hypothetical protein TH53_20180 [Pedobacter lusitanus]|uniref:Outer membrane protein beta-barrel domain-containing protein n=1 Tax=Pedobacter lusitanus TaxID=1503925 RepID=A0A0D0F1G4_9SPHI|nr:hypothetical protein [Pedobacter lusitanus]KIO75483.1 hypothetical protein TH53_20180 [Pedobacter lusitanus]